MLVGKEARRTGRCRIASPTSASESVVVRVWIHVSDSRADPAAREVGRDETRSAAHYQLAVRIRRAHEHSRAAVPDAAEEVVDFGVTQPVTRLLDH